MADFVIRRLNRPHLAILGPSHGPAGLSQAAEWIDDTRLQQAGEQEGHAEQGQQDYSGDDAVLREPGPEGGEMVLEHQPSQPLSLVDDGFSQGEPVICEEVALLPRPGERQGLSRIPHIRGEQPTIEGIQRRGADFPLRPERREIFGCRGGVLKCQRRSGVDADQLGLRSEITEGSRPQRGEVVCQDSEGSQQHAHPARHHDQGVDLFLDWPVGEAHVGPRP
jgi:hypothetical protein